MTSQPETPTVAAERTPHGRVLTVFSPKGGTGKTTVAVNLAIALSEAGRRRVCILDLDLAFGDVALTLQTIPTHTILDATQAVTSSLDWTLLESLLAPHPSGVSILAAPLQPSGKDLVSASDVRTIVSLLRAHHDVVVVDTPANFDDTVLAALDATDDCVVLTNLDVPGLKNTRLALDTLDALGSDSEQIRHLVVNKLTRSSDITVERAAAILHHPITTKLPEDQLVVRATNTGRPLVSTTPQAEFSQRLQALARTLNEAADRLHPDRQPPGRTPAPAPTTSKGHSLFPRRKKATS